MSDIDQKRQALLHAYPSHKWREKVNKMSDAQVIAIYLNLKRQKKI